MRKGEGIVLVLTMMTMIGASGLAIELKINHVLPPNDTIHVTCLEMAEVIAKRTNGEVTVSVYPNSELGNTKDNIEQLRRGVNVVAMFDPGYAADYVPEYAAMNGPFLYRNWEELRALDRSEWHRDQAAKAEEKGIKVLSHWYFGTRHIISGKEIKTPSDMRGVKVRVPPNKVWMDTITAMGGSPTPLQWAEVYSGLSQGVVDAAEAPFSTIYGSKLQEAKKRIALTGHFTGIASLGMSQAIFNSLSPTNQKIIEDTFAEYGDICSARSFEAEGEWRALLENEGVVFNEVDQDAFVRACMVVYDSPDWVSYDVLRKEIEKNMK